LIQSDFLVGVLMRLVPVVALMSSALALAACAGGGSDLGSGGLSITNCPITSVDFTPDNDCIDPGPTPPPTKPDKDGDGIPDETDTDGDSGSGAGGNNTALTPSTGTRTIVLKTAVYDIPEGTSTALAAITSGTMTADQTRDAILSPTSKPTSLKIRVDTNSNSNSTLAVPIEMTEYVYGTRDLQWLLRGHSLDEPANIAAQMIDVNGAPLAYNPAKGFVHTVADPDGAFDVDDAVDLTDDYYWNQITPFMTSRANGGAMANYREYRARDEILQVWAYQNSYVAMYENKSGGGTPKHQAYTFGGVKATNVPTAGLATYSGRFVGTAKSANWKTPDGSDVNPNADWRVQGSSRFNVDFDRSKITGTLTPESWTSYQGGLESWYTWNTASADKDPVSGDDRGSVYEEDPSQNSVQCSAVTCPEFVEIYGTRVAVDGTITANGDFSGSAKLVNNSTPYTTEDNAMHGGFFGTNATEVAGVFTAAGTAPDPKGGSGGITTNTQGDLSISGGFNATCIPGVTCAP
jgi:hypothetical protein